MKNTFEFTEKERDKIHYEIVQVANEEPIHYDEQFTAPLINFIEQIISERITPEPGESGQSAEDVLFEVIWQKYGQNYDILADGYSGPAFAAILHPLILAAMTTYASQVCADKDREIEVIQTDWKNKVDGWIMGYRSLEKELSAANESMAVAKKRIAELEQYEPYINRDLKTK